MGSPLSERARRTLLFRRDPQRALFEQQERMAKAVEAAATDAAVKAVQGIKDELEQMLEDESTSIQDKIKSIEKRVIAFAGDSLSLIQKTVRDRLKTMPHLKGDPGYTPKKGVDYFDGKPGDAGYTPRPNVDYPTIDSVRTMIADGMRIFTKKVLAYVDDRVDRAVAQALKSGMAPVVIARALETLKGADRLDFNALKNRPGTPVAEQQRHVLHRGGAKETYEYDLSDLCDGNTKVFAIPANSRIVAVFCTDAPAGFYRKSVDFTGTGTQVLTLTDEVTAPTQGASLSLLYVV